jgi:hypothetical protein
MVLPSRGRAATLACFVTFAGLVTWSSASCDAQSLSPCAKQCQVQTDLAASLGCTTTDTATCEKTCEDSKVGRMTCTDEFDAYLGCTADASTEKNCTCEAGSLACSKVCGTGYCPPDYACGAEARTLEACDLRTLGEPESCAARCSAAENYPHSLGCSSGQNPQDCVHACGDLYEANPSCAAQFDAYNTCAANVFDTAHCTCDAATGSFSCMNVCTTTGCPSSDACSMEVGALSACIGP